MVRTLFFVLIFVLGGGGVQAQSDSSGGDPPADSTETVDEGADWLLLPYASYSPDTKISVGFVAGYYRPERPGGPASSVQATITVTQRRQYIAEVSPELYLQGGQWRLQGAVQASHFPTSFYGIGGDTRAEAEEAYTARYVLLDQTAQRHIWRSLRVGPRVYIRHETVRDPEEDGLIANGNVPGGTGSTTAGLGLSAFWDARDSIYDPGTGTYGEVVTTLHSAVWGSDFTFGRLETDLRGYQPLGPGTLAGHVYTESVAGTAPFQLLPLLGGASRMRGYREGRFRDSLYWTLQAEYRVPLFWRFKATTFASLGDVGSRVAPALVQDVKVAVGLGGRLRLTDDGLHGRLDIAYSSNGPELYLSLGEAF